MTLSWNNMSLQDDMTCHICWQQQQQQQQQQMMPQGGNQQHHTVTWHNITSLLVNTTPYFSKLWHYHDTTWVNMMIWHDIYAIYHTVTRRDITWLFTQLFTCLTEAPYTKRHKIKLSIQYEENGHLWRPPAISVKNKR